MRSAIALLVCSLPMVGCMGGGSDGAGDSTVAAGDASPPASGVSAESRVTAAMRNLQGRDLGTLSLAESAGGITISGRLTGLPPGTHAIHLHMTGQCETPFQSAGGHWNPTSRQHGTANPQGPHFGDLPNITVANDSTVTVEAASVGGTLRGGNALLDPDGGAVVIHAGPDDYRTDPAGNAGARIACGSVSGR